MNLIVHGGAGGPVDEPADRQAVLDEAARAGADAPSVTDAVLAAVRVLEADPRFNAGVGGAVQSDGVVRTDAGLMTDDREVGAAAAMPGVERALDVARVVKKETPHVFVSGVHAVDLADTFDIQTEVDLWCDRSREKWAETDAPEGFGTREHLGFVRDRFGDGGDGQWNHDTVGAVAHEGDRLAAATSTGGRWCALAGRVGDVPQAGSGFYCARLGGASATGAGEDIARATLSRRAVDHLEKGPDPQAAADLAIEEFEDLTGSSAGVIVMGNDGKSGSTYNSESMQTAVASSED